ncbi:fungal-specific transcription factor domain-containing protein [Talaromyces proteolyticus]|uniref:Fungal-specific transcription factor domain-containing protein n=1 Tax=Talaromyces proteolyticus TaxID=1131652 RepID=A0AAD4PRF2_9EURO|nr:fungal-specific transcription factor domain-containing protein [Talaromyces proteolyticus]KAH8688756.1 fungal-specific transcription factor domain-containing protein [Talaromyces proteolyticus]
MPSRQRKQPENRRRTGCFQCKEKHVQCTEEKPSCRRCQRLGLVCERGIKLLFRDDAIQRGIQFGREGTWSKRCGRIKKPPVLELDEDFTGVPLEQYIGRWIWLNTTYDDFTGDLDNSDTDEALFQIDQNTTRRALYMQGNRYLRSPYLEPRSFGGPFSQCTYEEGNLLDYFIRGIGPNCSLSRSNNPYMSLIPLLSHTTFKNTLLAVSANQLYLLGDKSCSQEAFMYKDKALKGLQREIKSPTLHFATVASVLMMCFHDISDGCASSWLFHLRVGMQMTPQLPSYSAQTESLKRFFNMYFVGHDIMSRTGRIHCDDEWDEDIPTHNWLETDDLDEVDTTVGSSRRLMSLISNISSLTRKRANSNSSRVDKDFFTSSCEEIETALETLQQILPSNSSAADNYILQIAEIKRLTALLYLHECLGEFISSSPSPSTSSPPLSLQTYHSPPPPKLSKQGLVQRIIELISTLPNPDSTSVLWPLYIIGNSAGLEDESQRRFVLERLRGIQQTRNLGSVRAARVAVERAFRTRDLELPDSKGETIQKGRGVISLA